MVTLIDNKWVRWGAVVAWMGVIFFLSSQSRLPQVMPPLFPSAQDVLGHFVAYAILAGLLYRALAGLGAAKPASFALLIVFLYAVSDEFHQSFVPGRHPDVFDIATDVAGAGVLLLLLTHRLRRSRRPRR